MPKPIIRALAAVEAMARQNGMEADAFCGTVLRKASAYADAWSGGQRRALRKASRAAGLSFHHLTERDLRRIIKVAPLWFTPFNEDDYKRILAELSWKHDNLAMRLAEHERKKDVVPENELPASAAQTETETVLFPRLLWEIGFIFLVGVIVWYGATTLEYTDAKLGAILFALSLVVAYCLPGFIANARDHRNRKSVWVVNIFTGLTGIGWVVALAWALYVEKDDTAKTP